VDIVLTIFAGAFVGLAIGITGVGGGSLMTPILLLFGVPLHVAVGTDLLYAAVTKSGGAVLHARQRSIEWPLVLLLTAGSVPAALLTILALNLLFDSPDQYSPLITTALGIMLMATAAILAFRASFVRNQPVASTSGEWSDHSKPGSKILTFLMGIGLGVTVTLSSVGAAAVATAVLLLLYPRLSALQIVGTNMVHAVPLTLVAGLGHFYLGNVDLFLLLCLLIGSMPAIYVGTRIAAFMPDNILQPTLAVVLLVVGVRYTFF
jgi:uncharacterized membrane protein YfcA